MKKKDLVILVGRITIFTSDDWKQLKEEEKKIEIDENITSTWSNELKEEGTW